MKNITLAMCCAVVCAMTLGTATERPKISASVHRVLDSAAGDTLVVYVYFADKGPDADRWIADPLSLVSERSLERRRKVLPANHLVDYTDVSVYRPYVDLLAPQVTTVRHELRWLNCVSVVVTKSQALAVAGLDCVTKVDLVERYTVKEGNTEAASGTAPLYKLALPLADSLNYGASLGQDTLIKVNKVHNNGIYGQGVIVANFDAGFSNLDNQAFTTLPMNVWKKKDFETGDTVTLAWHFHGVATLSLVGGYAPGSLIGPAFGSTYILCRTEVDPTETPSEMDHWAAAAQWVDSLGADVITSSLGYLTFDTPYAGYSYLDMNGHTMPITIAAELAVHKGITVCNSAGNDGGNSPHNTLGGPADGEDVITVGALDPNGTKANYSSIGPTTDVPNRIKPDVMTQGTSNITATTSGIGFNGSGTSWACPMAAGVAACMLSANKDLTPLQIRNILRTFASNAGEPNNQIGWGTIDAQRSVDSARALDTTPPVIRHTQPFSVTTTTSAVTVTAQITDNGIIRYMRAGEAPRLYYRRNSGSGWGAWNVVTASAVKAGVFTFTIPGSTSGTSVQYYFAAQDIALPHAIASTLPVGGAGIDPPGTTAPAAFFQFAVGATDVAANGADVPSEYHLFANYPNPFNPSTDIRYDLPNAGPVTLKVYDVTGKMAATLVDRVQAAGRYTIRFDASALATGVYVYQLTAGAFTARHTMLLLK